MPARYLSALSRQAEEAPSRDVFFPVITVPSSSSMATAGPSVSSALFSAAGTTGVDVAGVMQVAEPLTKAQLAACAPEVRLEWMDDFTGFAAYYLKDGAGAWRRSR